MGKIEKTVNKNYILIKKITKSMTSNGIKFKKKNTYNQS